MKMKAGPEHIRDVKRDKKATEAVEKKRAAAKAAVPSINAALEKYRKQPSN